MYLVEDRAEFHAEMCRKSCPILYAYMTEILTFILCYYCFLLVVYLRFYSRVLVSAMNEQGFGINATILGTTQPIG